jgi:hypothetical protein
MDLPLMEGKAATQKHRAQRRRRIPKPRSFLNKLSSLGFVLAPGEMGMPRIPSMVLFVAFSLGGYGADILTSDKELAALLPHEAYEGVGSWANGGYLIATGHTIPIDALGDAKGRRTEKEFSEEDAKRRLILKAAAEKTPDVNEQMFDVVGDMTGFRVAASYQNKGTPGLFTVAVVEKKNIKIEVNFNTKKAREFAFHLFQASQFKEAAEAFSVLTQRGVQDAETVAYARAASWQVNLDSGVRGNGRTEALSALGSFYEEHDNLEAALQRYYALYKEIEKPERSFLEKLAGLCERTHRQETAERFRAEILRRFAPPENPKIKDASIEKSFEALLMQQPLLLKNGGARLIKYDGATYFVAVGVTEIEQDSPTERLRRLRVGRMHAQREAVSFAEATQVSAEDKKTETTVSRNEDGKKHATVVTTFDEITIARVKGAVKSLAEIGTWITPDGTLFCFALGRKLE